MFASLHTSTLALAGVERRRGGLGIFSRLRTALQVAAQRRRLAELDDALLADIGLTRAQALAEAGRPMFAQGYSPAVWNAPYHWFQRPSDQA